MKYLNLFEDFELGGEDIISTIKDILLELEDEGYVVTYSDFDKVTYFMKMNSFVSDFKINISKDSEFTLKDISDTLLRLFHYTKVSNISLSGKRISTLR
jgi:hypothetical protein